MKTTKIVVTDYIEPDLEWERKQLAGSAVTFEEYQLKFAPLPDLLARLGDADVLVVNMVKMSREVIENLHSCKLIIRHGVGYDNVDVPAATEHGVQVCYVPDYCREEVAEQAMMLLLTCRRKFTKQQESLEVSVKKGQWDFSAVGAIRRFSGTTAGIVGCGRIGSLVVQMLRGFGIEVMVHDPYLSERRQSELGIRCMPLEQVLGEADMVTIHPALTHETKYMIGERELRMMKPTAIIVNTARGAIVNADALAKACKEGWIAGAGIDVFEKEPPDETFVLRGIPNIILTPHLAWYSEDAGVSIREKIMEDIKRFLEGRQPRFPINTINAKR
ncbi:MAG: NAD-binding D-isomer specific 2-hydroxyacid dehydrogenase [Bacteroidetes bacterium]|jgi:D-3-phosphoglycerate dehydrogenase|nr:NAD-binding D-isomer specific 2-hydroxyacid dehydrogenase [Bacteroidota bacterium]